MIKLLDFLTTKALDFLAREPFWGSGWLYQRAGEFSMWLYERSERQRP